MLENINGYREINIARIGIRIFLNQLAILTSTADRGQQQTVAKQEKVDIKEHNRLTGVRNVVHICITTQLANSIP